MNEIEIAFTLLVAFCAGRVWERNTERERAALRSESELNARLKHKSEAANSLKA